MPFEITEYGEAQCPPRLRELLARMDSALRLDKTYCVQVLTEHERPDLPVEAWCIRPSVYPSAPNGGICVRENILKSGRFYDVLSHELAHVVAHAELEWVEGEGHWWPFATIHAVFLRRLDEMYRVNLRSRWASFQRLIMLMNVYDVSSEPEANWGWALNQALTLSAKWASEPISEMEVVERLWETWYSHRYRGA
ncbi:hypothetical protein ACLGIX_18150 [Burkholderia vietnamiensis]